jgi:hypothetical protein
MIEKNVDGDTRVFVAARMQQIPHGGYVRMIVGERIDGPVQLDPYDDTGFQSMPLAGRISFDEVANKIADQPVLLMA